jgi:hypothetical protein
VYVCFVNGNTAGDIITDIMKTKLFKTAWAIAGKYATFAKALVAAWKVIKMTVKMQRGVINFSFKKLDGTIRQAVGTLKNIPATKGTKESNLTVLTYFDVEADGFRAAKIENILF